MGKTERSFVMINVDASLKMENHSGGIGVIIRNDTGGFIAACNNLILHALDAYTLEFKAIIRGIALANEIGCSKTVIQSDCLQVIKP